MSLWARGGTQPLVVQYFERNRFEHHPENAGTQYEVLLGAFGRVVTAGRENEEPFKPAEPVKTRDAKYFPETQHNIRLGAFVTYWNTHGGLSIHGYLISEQFEEKNPVDGKTYLVQYFERSRFEYHPENVGTPYEVLLGQLGTEVARKKGYPYGWYPLYGRAADYSWVSGRLVFDGRLCIVCGCTTVRYNQTGTFLDKGVSVRQVGPGWEAGSAQLKLTSGDFLVLFGSISQQALDAEPNPSETCEKPRYSTDKVQRNPAR